MHDSGDHNTVEVPEEGTGMTSQGPDGSRVKVECSPFGEIV